MQRDTYIQKNDGYITNSKLKCFLRNPQEYFIQFVKKVEIQETDKRHFVVGGAIDDLLSFGEDYFLSKYYIDEGYVVDDLKDMLKKRDGLIVDGKLVSKLKLPELRYYYYGLNKNEKVRLTEKEGQDIMGMYREIKRQPLADYGNQNYEKQKEVICNYGPLKLKGTLDRFSLEDKLIRDWKTTGRFDSFEYDMEDTFDYIMQMAFYFVLAKIEYGIDCDVVLDVIHKNEPYQYVAYRLDKNRLLKKTIDKIKPGLNALIKAYETDIREPINPLTGQPIPRSEATKSPYYPYMDLSIQKSFIAPF